tara:strand:- start:4878 stop:5690 length:813 start_codon:yes stop_codon:yes gene_type:complete
MEPHTLKNIRIAVITQNDNYVIPRNLKLLCDEHWIDISEVVIVNAKGSLENKKLLFIKGFGLSQTLKMALVTLVFKFRSLLAGSFRFLGKSEWLNLRGLCSLHEIPYGNESNVNDENFIKRLAQYKLDLVVSFSAPTVFKKDLLNLARHGCINLHSSALPSYAGVLPSFWMLLNNEKKAGVSVHLMDSMIDNGAVIKQDLIDISSMNNMFDVIQATKFCGGHSMLNVLDYLHKNGKLPDPIDTSHNQRSYFSWPKVEDIKKLVAGGKRLI